MHIHYLSNSPLHLKPANAIHVMNMCESFSNNGHTVTLYAMTNSSCRDYHRIYGVENNFNLKLVKKRSWKYFFPLYYSLLQVLRVPRKNNSICYARCPISAYIALFLGVETIFEIHEVPHTQALDYIYRFILDRKNLLRVIVISESLLKDLIAKYPNINNLDVVVAHDGANIAKENASIEIFSRPKNKLYKKNIGYAGGLRDGNGISIILKLAQENSNLLFRIAGGTQEQINYWKNSYLGENIEWLGQLDPHQVPGFLSSCDILLAPYQKGPKTSAGRDTSRWMSPLKLFEYMAAGKPIMLSDFAVLREIVTESDVVFIEADNISIWNAKLRELVNDDSLAKKLGFNCLNVLRNKYTWDKRADLVLKELKI